MFFRRLKVFFFRRGFMPQGDFHEMKDRVFSHRDEIFDKPAKKHLTGPGADTSFLMPDEAKEIWEKQRAAFQKEAGDKFLKVFNEEAEAQWDRIIDRRTHDWFYSGIISFIVGFIVGKLV